MSAPLRIGILGTGNIAGRALIAPAKDDPDVTIEAVGSRTPERAAAFAAANDIPRTLDYEQLIASPDIDIVYITLPPALHAHWTIRALQAGKHVLCEKPMAANADEARAVARVCEGSDRVYMEAFHYPYHSFAKRVRDMLDTHVIGRIRNASASFQIPGKFIVPGNIRRQSALGGGAMADAGCYALHALRGILGEVEGVLEATAEADPADAQVDLRMQAKLAFGGQVIATLHASFLADDKPEIDVIVRGDKGSLQITSLYVPQWGGALRLTWGGRTYTEMAEPTPSYVYQLRELVRCIRDGAPVLTSAADGVLNMSALDSIYRQAGLQVRGA